MKSSIPIENKLKIGSNNSRINYQSTFLFYFRLMKELSLTKDEYETLSQDNKKKQELIKYYNEQLASLQRRQVLPTLMGMHAYQCTVLTRRLKRNLQMSKGRLFSESVYLHRWKTTFFPYLKCKLPVISIKTLVKPVQESNIPYTFSLIVLSKEKFHLNVKFCN